MRLVRGASNRSNVSWQQEQAVAKQPLAQPVKQRRRPKRPQGAQHLHVLTLRVPEELFRRLDADTVEVQAAQPYLRLSRADVLRMLVDEGLPGANS